MKNVKVYLTALLLSISFLFSNCSKNSNAVVPTEEVLISHLWSIDYYYQNQDMTSQFSPYSLIFSSTGAVAGQKGNEYFSGTWTLSVDGNQHEIVSIHFSPSEPNLDLLNLDWTLMDKASTTLQFEESNTATSLRIKILPQ